MVHWLSSGRRRVALAMAALLLVLAPASRLAAADRPGSKPLTRQLQFSACYVKEDRDRAWQLRFTGDLPRGPGLYAIVYNEAGDAVLQTAIPYGRHTQEKPWIVEVPADGKAQQYVIKFLGQQDNFNGILLPLTDLPYEVYGDSSYSFGYGTAAGQQRMVAFQVSSGAPVHFNGYGDYRILDEAGGIVVESKEKALKTGDPAKKGGAREVEVIVTGLQPGQTYWIDPYGLMYLGVRDTRLYVTFEPGRWFEPKLEWTLQSRPWWKGLVHVEP